MGYRRRRRGDACVALIPDPLCPLCLCGNKGDILDYDTQYVCSITSHVEAMLSVTVRFGNQPVISPLPLHKLHFGAAINF